MLVVKRIYPFRQLVHIVRTGDEFSTLIIKPESTIRIMSGRENGGTVFQGDTYHLCLAIGSNLHLIANGSNPQISWRHQASLASRANWFYSIVVGTINLLTAFHKIISSNAVNRWNTARINTGMPDSSNRWYIRNHCIFAGKSLL